MTQEHICTDGCNHDEVTHDLRHFFIDLAPDGVMSDEFKEMAKTTWPEGMMAPTLEVMLGMIKFLLQNPGEHLDPVAGDILGTLMNVAMENALVSVYPDVEEHDEEMIDSVMIPALEAMNMVVSESGELKLKPTH